MAGSIDLVGLDRDGTLALVALAGDDAEEALGRLLDQYLWASTQRALLARLYAPSGLGSEGRFRCLLLSPSFNPAFLQRLSLLAIEVTPYLARRVQSGGEAHLWIEPAAAIFAFSGRDRDWNGRGYAPLAEDNGQERPAVVESGTERRSAPAASDEVEEPVEDSVAPEGDDFQLFDAFPSLLDDPRPAEPLETLTPEELEEFQRFEEGRQGDRRRSS